MFCKYNLTLLNTLDFCEGAHTRIHRYKSRLEKSILDYVFVSSDLKKNVISMCIDEQTADYTLAQPQKWEKIF